MMLSFHQIPFDFALFWMFFSISLFFEKLTSSNLKENDNYWIRSSPESLLSVYYLPLVPFLVCLGSYLKRHRFAVRLFYFMQAWDPHLPQ